MLDFPTLVQILLDYGYFIMFLASYVEGGLSMIAGGFLVSLGYFNFSFVVLAMFAGDFLSDLMWYSIGYYGGNRILNKITKVFNISDARLQKVREKLERNAGKILITVKLTTGLCLATMITSGAIRLKLKKFIPYDIIGSFFWTLMVVALGYFFGESYSILNNIIKLGGVSVIILLFIILFLYYHFNRKQPILVNNNHD